MIAVQSAELDQPLIDAALEAVQRRAGLVFPDSRLTEVKNAIRKAWRIFGQSNAAAFMAQLETDSAIFDGLVDQLTVGETYFFREPAQFDLIRRHILPDLLARRAADRRLRVWSAGCASGEEPYSLAILFEQEAVSHRTTIIGSDLSPAALRSAREARYRSWSLRGSDPDFIARYFDKIGEHMRLSDRVRQRVRFERYNLNAAVLPEFAVGADLILCRNVMIYFEGDTIARLARMLFDALDDHGWLLTAPADPLLTEYAPFVLVNTPGGIAYRRQPTAAAISEIGPVSRLPSKPPRKRTPRVAKHGSAPPPLSIAVPVAVPVAVPSDLQSDLQSVRDAFARGAFDQVLHVTASVPRDAEVWALRIRSLANSGAIDIAAVEAGRAVEQFPLKSELHYLRAIVSLGLGRDDDAIAALSRAIYLDRQFAIAHFALGVVLRRQGNEEAAGRAFENVTAICQSMPPEQSLLSGEGETAAGLAAAARNASARIAGRFPL